MSKPKGFTEIETEADILRLLRLQKKGEPLHPDLKTLFESMTDVVIAEKALRMHYPNYDSLPEEEQERLVNEMLDNQNEEPT